MEQVCRITCEEANNCQLLSDELSFQGCLTECAARYANRGIDCIPTGSRLNACVAAVRTASCSDVLGDPQVPCERLCVGGTPNTDSGPQDAGGTDAQQEDSSADSGPADAGRTDAAMNCAQLFGCCDQLTGQDLSRCVSTVFSGDDNNCAAEFARLQDMSLCTTG